ncbi:MAG: SRPBCC family protein [Planctomycetes bacterium]|nr:SRPBCC family protein [Planctomycetota bacterium]
MKYSLQIDIALPRARVIELFDNPDNMSCWQPGLVSYEHLSGDPGQVDAKAKLVYKMGKRDIDENNTRWDFFTEFKLSGFLKIMGWIMPWGFKKQSFKFMKLFKEFAEKA